jgi:RNA polymerase sigma factor (sigma-70 family)
MEDLLIRIRRGENGAIEEIYRLAYPSCQSFVLNNNGTVEDAKDVFQESLIVLMEYLDKGDFELSCKLQTFIYSIFRRLWLKQLKKSGRLPVELYESEKEYINIEEDQISYKKEQEQKHIHINKVFASFKEDCRKVLTAYYYNNASLSEIAQMMGYTDNFIKIKKGRCMDALKKAVKESYNHEIKED